MAMIAMEDRGDMARSSCPPEEREEGGGGEAWDSPSQSQPLIATIDDSCRLRILHPEVYDRSVDLLKASSSFRANIARFHEMTKKILDHISEQAKKVDNAKLKAMAMRNLVQEEIENRPKRMKEQTSLVADKQMELERLNVEYESLQLVQKEQESMIAQLTRSTPLN